MYEKRVTEMQPLQLRFLNTWGRLDFIWDHAGKWVSAMNINITGSFAGAVILLSDIKK